MPEVATAGIFLPIPVISEFDLRILVTGRSKKDEREASFLVLRPPLFLKAQEIEKSDSFVNVPDTDHGMQIFGHVRNSLRRTSATVHFACPRSVPSENKIDRGKGKVQIGRASCRERVCQYV